MKLIINLYPQEIISRNKCQVSFLDELVMEKKL